MSSFFLYLCITLFIFVCLLLVMLILIQKGRGGGLASAFGGAGGHTAFGAKTGDVLTWVTSVIFGIFLLLAIALNLIADSQNKRAAAPATKDETTVTIPGPEAPAPTGEALPPNTTPVAPTPPALPAPQTEK